MWFRTIFRRKPEAVQEASPAASPADLTLSGQVFSRLNRLRLNSSRRLRGAGAGQRPSPRRRPAADFREHRKYVSGDDFRFVDWKASARSEQVYLKQGEEPQETFVHLLIDTSASMAWGEPPKYAAVLRMAAALGYLALNGDDRLHLLTLANDRTGAQEWSFKGKGQFPVFWNVLKGLPHAGAGRLASTVRTLTRSNRGGMVLLLSDLLDVGDLAEALSLLPRPAWEVSVLHTLHRQELEPALNGEFELVDSESGTRVNYDIDRTALENYQGHFETWRESLERICIDHKTRYTLVPTDWSLDREVLPQLQRIDLLDPV